MPILQSLEKNPDINIFSPCGIFLINKPLGHNNVDESLIFSEIVETTLSSTRDSTADAWLEVENALGKAIRDDPTVMPDEPPVAHTIIFKGKEIDKSRLLVKYSKYRKNVSSTDRLRRVQDVKQYFQNSTPFKISDLNNSEPTQSERVITISDPVAMVVCSDDQFWLCIGTFNSIQIDGKPAASISLNLLQNTLSQFLTSSLASGQLPQRMLMNRQNIMTGDPMLLASIHSLFLANLFSQ